MRVTARGKSFLLGSAPFRFRGVRHEQPRVPAADRAEREFPHALDGMVTSGYTVVCLPPPSLLDLEYAVSSGLRFLLEVDLEDVARLSRRHRKRLVRELTTRVRNSVRPWQGSDALLGVALGSPSGQARFPNAAMRCVADELAVALHDDDASLLTGWRQAWPVEGECSPEFDFLIIEPEVRTSDGLSHVLMSCHSAIGDRPLVLNMVLSNGGDQEAGRDLTRTIDTALRLGIAGTIDRHRGCLDPAGIEPELARANLRTVGDLDVDWPSISVVVSAYNAAGTIDECLSHCDRLGYPKLEVIVVDDGSTDATPKIVGTHARARLLTIPHGGLSTARNVGYRSARGELIAYLDADAYPSPEWPWYLALAALGDGVAGSGGPNVPPPDESSAARVVAHSPGGPVPQLLGPDRAKHLPGCNMAFWSTTLAEFGGFDPVLERAAEDLEFEWRVTDRGYKIGYHPAALVWHRRRPGLRPYMRQQRHYGRAQAILERRYPERFPAAARLRNARRRLACRRGSNGSAASFPVRYVSLPRDAGAPLELAHQWGMPVAIVLAATAPLALVRRKLSAPALAATAFLGALVVIDLVVAGDGLRRVDRTVQLRTSVAAFRLLRPLAFRWGHLTGRLEAQRAAPEWPQRPAEVTAE